MPAWSGLYEGVHGQPHAILWNTRDSRGYDASKINKHLRTLAGRKLAKLMQVLTGVVPGSSAVFTYRRPAVFTDGLSNPAAGGGVRNIETVTLVNRVTTAADATNIIDMITRANSQAISAYPRDRSGNGGGGKLTSPTF